MSSFYGGRPGKNFTISKVFKNKLELVEDLQSGWTSSIGEGEIVIISYGKYSTAGNSEYQKNYQVDYNNYQEIFNSTIWKKIYLENGISTDLNLGDNLTIIDKNGEPIIIGDDSSVTKTGLCYLMMAALSVTGDPGESFQIKYQLSTDLDISDYTNEPAIIKQIENMLILFGYVDNGKFDSTNLPLGTTVLVNYFNSTSNITYGTFFTWTYSITQLSVVKKWQRSDLTEKGIATIGRWRAFSELL